MKPIFFAWTRSFWFTVIGVLVMIFGAPEPVLLGIGQIIAVVTPWTPEVIGNALVKVAPLILWVAALQQRSGAARPYTSDPRALD